MIASASRSPPRLVCKVGGSLLDGGWAPAVMAALRRAAPRGGILALAGGGHAADRIRARHRRGELGLSEAHWAAIRVLDVTALRLAGGSGDGLPVTTGLRIGPVAGVPAPLAVLAPSPLLRREDPLPHGWHVTSDSIAAWVAARCGASDLLLLKASDGCPRSPAGADGSLAAGEAARRGLVDRHLPELLADSGPSAWIVDGRRPGRLLDLLTGDATAGGRLRA